MNMKSLPILLLAFAILQSSCFNLAISCGIFENPLGSVTPDQDIKVGSPFIFRCTLFPETVGNHSVTSDQLILRFSNRSSPYVTLTPTSIIDEYTVEYAVAKASIEDNGDYSCFVPTLTEKIPQMVCLSSINVGYPPLNVSNFSCISFDYTNLTCSWTEPENNVKTKYLLYDFLIGQSFKRECPVPIKPSSCQYRLDTKPVYIKDQESLSFVLIGKNVLGESKQYYKINHYEIIKPGVPTFIQFSDVRETSMVINISASKGLQYREFADGLIYSIKYYSVSTPLNITKEILVSAESGNANVKLDGLVPRTVYDFEVRCRLNLKSDVFIWSDSKIGTELTKSDVPYLAPVIYNSAFDYQSIAGNRTVSIYWQPVPPQFENGEEFHYVIKYHESYVPSRFSREVSKRSSSYINIGNKTSATIERLDPGQAYIFIIVPANKEGKSANETAQIVIDKTEKMLQGPRDISVVSYGKSLYNISWKTPDVRYTDFDLFWCEVYQLSSTKCDGPLKMVSVTGQTQRKLILPDSNTNYQFAVSTTYGSQTSGMHWAPCTVVHNMKYNVLKMELIPKTSTSLRVRWSMRCEAEKKVVKEYSIHYCAFSGNCTYDNAKHCEVNGQGPLKWPHVNIQDGSTSEYILGDLKPYTCYAAYMRVRTGVGWGESSDFTYESTMQSAPGDAPGNVHTVVKDATIQVSFDPPTIPNGRITRYVVYYNKTSADEANYHKEYRVTEDAHGKLDGIVALDNVNYYTNYSIEVTACVDQACSVPSEPVYVTTGISNPGIIVPPRVEVLERSVNISWAAPLLPNGPVQYYQVLVEGQSLDESGIHNVSGSTFLLLEKNCDFESNNETYFQVRAVNLKDGHPLFGDFSGPTKTILCPTSYISMKIGIIIGGLLLSIVFLCAAAYSGRRFYRSYVSAKSTKVQLPKGLDSPLDNPINSYDKFKSGLKNHHDSGIPNDRAYDRLFSSNSDRDLVHPENDKRGSSGRNNSGESTASAKCHTSISSANTTKTHNSMDSGAEVESPLSPDSFSSDSGSANTTPLPFKPDLNIVDESNHLASRDSGLERDNLPAVYVPREFPKRHFSVEKESILRSMEKSLSSSAPSVKDEGEKSQERPLPPYTQFGYGRSQSVKNLDGYSKIGEPDTCRHGNTALEFRNHQVCHCYVDYEPNRSNSLSLGRKQENSLPLNKKNAKGSLLQQKNKPVGANERRSYSVVGEASAPSNQELPYVSPTAIPSQRTMPYQSPGAAVDSTPDLMDPQASPADGGPPFFDHIDLESIIPDLGERVFVGRSASDKDSGNGSDPEKDATRSSGIRLLQGILLSGGGIVDGSFDDFMKCDNSADVCSDDETEIPEETLELAVSQNNSSGYTTLPQPNMTSGYVSSAALRQVTTPAHVTSPPNLTDISIEGV